MASHCALAPAPFRLRARLFPYLISTWGVWDWGLPVRIYYYGVIDKVKIAIFWLSKCGYSYGRGPRSFACVSRGQHATLIMVPCVHDKINKARNLALDNAQVSITSEANPWQLREVIQAEQELQHSDLQRSCTEIINKPFLRWRVS